MALLYKKNVILSAPSFCIGLIGLSILCKDQDGSIHQCHRPHLENSIAWLIWSPLILWQNLYVNKVCKIVSKKGPKGGTTTCL